MKWMECEAISFNDVQDKSAWQQLLRQCVQQPRGRAQRQHRQAVTVYAPATQQASCHWPVHCIVSTGDMFVWCQFCGWKRVTRHTIEHITHRKPAVNLHLLGNFSAWRFFISIRTVYVKNAVSHITKNSLQQHNVTGICGLFDPPLHPQTWG